MKTEALSNRTLKEAINLVVKLFDSKPSDIDYPGKWMPASISKKKDKKLFASANCTYVKYYVGIDKKSKKVIGVVGIFTKEDDEKDSAWLAWLCVDPKYRGKGYGGILLDLIITISRNRGKKFLKLYTSKKDLKEAMPLYEKRDFKLTKIKKSVWMNKNLSKGTVFMVKKL